MSRLSLLLSCVEVAGGGVAEEVGVVVAPPPPYMLVARLEPSLFDCAVVKLMKLRRQIARI